MALQPRVAELVADPILDKSWVVAGSSGLERFVEDVTWYDGNFDGAAHSLVLCDGSRIHAAYQLDALIRRASDAGAAALLVATEGVRPLLSSVRLADRLSLPVLWLECETPPITLLAELAMRIRASEQVRARTIEALLRALTALRTGQEILAAAGKVVDAELSLVTSNGGVILGEPVDFGTQIRPHMTVPQRTDHVLVHPVLDPEDLHANAWLACPYERADSARLDILAVGLAMAEPFVRSWLSSERARVDRDVAFQAHLLSQVIAEGDSVSRDVVEAAVSLGWRLQGWHVGIHVLAEDVTGRAERDSLIGRFRQALIGQGLSGVAAVDRGDSWALWAGSDTEPRIEQTSTLLRSVRLAAVELPHTWRLAIGIGRPHQGPVGLATTLGEARDASDLARSHDFRPTVEHADELGVARLLATWQRSAVTQAFAESALSPLRGPENQHLLTTLRTYLESGGSVGETAQILGVHRNTVSTRVASIRERLGIDFDSPSQRLALQVACRSLQD